MCVKGRGRRATPTTLNIIMAVEVGCDFVPKKSPQKINTYTMIISNNMPFSTINRPSTITNGTHDNVGVVSIDTQPSKLNHHYYYHTKLPSKPHIGGK